MPKQILKINQFHGGLNSNSDPRDVAENELTGATDIMVDELGKVRLMGGTGVHVANSNPTVVINAGYGLFYFSHDRREGNDAGADDVAETGDNYLVLADTDGDVQFFIYSSEEDAWGGSAVIDLGTTTGAKPAFYAVDGALRISDGNFGANNANKWYGYIYRHTFGDGSTGCDDFTGSTQGKLIDKWVSLDQELTALPIQSITDRRAEGTAPDIGSPVRIVLYADHNTYSHNANNPYLCRTFSADQSPDASTHTLYATFTLANSGETMTLKASEQAFCDLTTFCSVGDQIYVSDSEEGLEYLHEVDAVTSTVITFSYGYIDEDHTNDLIYLANLSRMNWWDNSNRYLQFAMSTIYDGNQESALNIHGTNQYLGDLIGATDSGQPHLDIHNPLFGVDIFAHEDGTFQSTYPRVTGFKIYVRRANGLYTSGIGEFVLMSEVSIKEGLKRSVEIDNEFDMWNDAFVHSTMCTAGEDNMTDYSWPFPSITEAPYGETDIINVTGFKTAVIANRMAYIGNVKQDGIVYGDRVLKSEVNKFDTFPEARKIEASVNDGDSIVKLEAYADRLLIFKQDKLELVNISQEVEFLEDTFMHKGVSHPAATCKTDFGIAWVNEQGCYLYDGQKVDNLFEKQGRQIIKESEWDDWINSGDVPIIGYIPKKRQIIIRQDCIGNTPNDGDIYLYDMVTTSWVTGTDKIPSDDDTAVSTNFINDWNGDLVVAHSSGTVVKWNDSAVDSTAMVMTTKDIDFGNPGQKKTVYKVIVTYQSGGGTTNVQVDYDVNAGTTFPYDFANGTNFTSTELDAATGWQTAELVPDVLSEASNIKSFRLRFATDGTVPAAFEINDISIVFRLKGIR